MTARSFERPPGSEPLADDQAAAAPTPNGAEPVEGAATGGAPWAEAGSLPWTPKNMMVPYVLLALSAYAAHGYAIQQYLRGLGFLSMNITTVYRTLRQLEKQGLVSSYWEPGDGGPAKRMYTLTEAGRATLGIWANALEGYRAMIDAFFKWYGLPTPPMPGLAGRGQQEKEERE